MSVHGGLGIGPHANPLGPSAGLREGIANGSAFDLSTTWLIFSSRFHRVNHLEGPAFRRLLPVAPGLSNSRPAYEVRALPQ